MAAARQADDRSTGSGSGGNGSYGDPNGAPGGGNSHGGTPTGGNPYRATWGRTCAILGGAGVLALLLIVILTVVLSRTLLAPDPEADATTTSPTSPSAPRGEYVPGDTAPPPAPEETTSPCTVPDGEAVGSEDSDTLTGGNLSVTLPSGWTIPWSTSHPYLTEVGSRGRTADPGQGLASVVIIGAVTFPDDEGGYPGIEDAALTLLQCTATTGGVLAATGEDREVTDFRSEETQIDGHDAWATRALYHYEDPDKYESAWATEVTAIVVETDQGPQAIITVIAIGVDGHEDDRDAIIGSVEVTS
jgi:hypothetical protein